MNQLPRALSLSLLPILALFSTSDVARADTVTVTVYYSVTGQPAVPISSTAMWLLALMLAGLAYRAINRKPGRGLWLLIAAISFLVLTPGNFLVPTAEANLVGATTFNLVLPSPFTSPDLVVNQDVSLVNATGNVIHINGIIVNSSKYTDATPSSSPECLYGTVLQPGDTCYIRFGISLF